MGENHLRKTNNSLRFSMYALIVLFILYFFVNVEAKKNKKTNGQEVNKNSASIKKDTKKIFFEKFDTWPQKWKNQVSKNQIKSVLQQVDKSILKQVIPDVSKEKIDVIVHKEVFVALYQIAELLVEEDMKTLVLNESGFMSESLREKIIFDEKVLLNLLSEMKGAFIKDIGTASMEEKPLLLINLSEKKLLGIIQNIFLREKEKFTSGCLKENLPEDVAFDQKKYWLLFPLAEKLTKEQETFPYVDEWYFLCKAASENDLSYCGKISNEGGKAGHKEDCETFALLYTKIFPELKNGNYPSDVINQIFNLKTSPNAQKDLFAQFLKIYMAKDAAGCNAIKVKDYDLYLMCQSAINRNVKVCATANFQNVCVQSAYAFEAFLYNDDTKVKEILYEDISIPWLLLGKLYFNKNACAEFYENIIKKRYCNNLYMYKPSKEEKKDEKEKKQK